MDKILTPSKHQNSEEIWNEVVTFMQDNGHYPTQNGLPSEKKLRKKLAVRVSRGKNSNDPFTQKLVALHQQWVRPQKTLSQWLSRIRAFIDKEQRWPLFNGPQEERTLYSGIQRTIDYYGENSTLPEVQEMVILKNKWGKGFAERQTPEQWLDILEPWIKSHQRRPSSTDPEEANLYYGAQNMLKRNPQHPATQELKKLWEQYAQTPDVP